MKVLFIHDHPFFRDEDNIVYSGGSFPHTIWDNYLTTFDSVTVVGRQQLHKKKKGLTLSSKAKVTFSLIPEYSSVPNFFRNYRIIKRKINQEIDRTDIVIVRLPSILGVCAGLSLLKRKKVFIVEQVGNAKEALTTYGSLFGKITAYALDSLNKKIVNKAPYVVYVTEKKLQRDYPSEGKTVSISDVILPEVLKIEDIKKDRFTDKVMKIALIGGFDAKYKGQDILLNAISMLPNDIKQNIELFFVGKGDYQWVLNNAKELSLQENVKFIGPKKSGAEIFEFLKDMTLYVQPSLTEGMPRAMLEAMSVGCPVLASNVGGIPDLLDGDLLHNPKDSTTFAHQILNLYTNRDLLIDLSMKNIKTVQPYQKDNLNERRLKFFQDIRNNYI